MGVINDQGRLPELMVDHFAVAVAAVSSLFLPVLLTTLALITDTYFSANLEQTNTELKSEMAATVWEIQTSFLRPQ